MLDYLRLGRMPWTIALFSTGLTIAMGCFIASGAAPEVGDVVPEIEGEDIDGVKFKLSDYRGKVVVLDFWGDW